MKWFQHFSTAHKNLKFQRLLDELGWEGYGQYWVCVELVADQGLNCRISSNKNWKGYLQKLFHYNEEKLGNFLIISAQSNLIDEKALKKGDLYIPKLKEYSDDWTKREDRMISKFPKENYIKVEQEYIKLKKVTLQGDEWLPLKKEIKTMFKSGHTPEEIIKCMKWMSEDEFYKDKWTMATARKKLPEFLGGTFKEEIKKPSYAKC